MVTAERVAEALPYVPKEKAEAVLKQSARTVAGAGGYMRAEDVVFDEEEARQAARTIRKLCKKQRYCPLHAIDLQNAEDAYPNLPRKKLVEVFVGKYLEGYRCKGGIVCREDAKVTQADIIRDFCLQMPKFTQQILINFVKNVRKDFWNLHCLAIARSVCIQINKTTFVQVYDLNFDVDAIDNIITAITRDKPTPIMAIDSYSMFPALADYEWNYYLLGSFCRLVSKRFSLISPIMNHSSKGIICRKDEKFSNYSYLAARVALADGIAPEFEACADYVIKKGVLLAKRRDSIESMMNAMREIENAR